MENKRVLALKKFMGLDYHRLDGAGMWQLYLDIFNFRVRYIMTKDIDIYVDILHFIKDGVERIKNGEEVWYKEDFTKAGLLEGRKVERL